MSTLLGKEPEKPTLPVHEWLAVVIMAAFMVTLTLITLVSDPEVPTEGAAIHVAFNRTIEVEITGAVEKPGKYRVEPGVLLKEVLVLAVPNEKADLHRLKMEKKLNRSTTVNVPSIEMITIMIEGAVNNSGPMEIPKGSIVKELIPLISFAEGADFSKLDRKRTLKDQEKINVPLIK
jgi:hypothetical protein